MLYQGATFLLAAVMAVLGIVMLVLTAVRGGGVGLVIGVMFLAAGAGRMYLLYRKS